VADLALSYTPSGTAAGNVVVDLALGPAGDAALVVGTARLAQDMARFLATPAGAHFSDPTYGTSLWSMIGRPAEASDEVYTSAVEELESSFLHGQTVAAAAGYLDLSAQLEAITDTRVDRSQAGVVGVGFVARTRSGESVQASTPVGG
jgi:hypothetical protein